MSNETNEQKISLKEIMSKALTLQFKAQNIIENAMTDPDLVNDPDRAKEIFDCVSKNTITVIKTIMEAYELVGANKGQSLIDKYDAENAVFENIDNNPQNSKIGKLVVGS